MLFGTHAKVFIAVVEQGNIQAAASVLKISQSSVSYHLKELEKEVGFQLYDRSQKPNHLTEEGALLFRELRQEREHPCAHTRKTKIRVPQSDRHCDSELWKASRAISAHLSLRISPRVYLLSLWSPEPRSGSTANSSTETLIGRSQADCRTRPIF